VIFVTLVCIFRARSSLCICVVDVCMIGEFGVCVYGVVNVCFGYECVRSASTSCNVVFCTVCGSGGSHIVCICDAVRMYVFGSFVCCGCVCVFDVCASVSASCVGDI